MDLKPDDFKNDDYGLTTNQYSHYLVGLYITTILSMFTTPVISVLIFFFAYTLIWELYHYIKHKNTVIDSINDTIFCMFGSISVFFVDQRIILPMTLAGLYVEYIKYRRRKK